MKNFSVEFNSLDYVIKQSKKVLLFAHSSPDSDTIGSVLALKEYIESLGKEVDIACFDPYPEYLREISDAKFEFPDHLQINTYDSLIACDSVERGFQKILNQVDKKQATVLIDHHPDINFKGDITIIDPAYSSTCELVYDFFVFNKIEITRKIATFLLLGILGDTGVFQHANTNARVMEIASDLMKKGAPASKLVEISFANRKLSTLKLWGKAFEKAKINPKNGMIVTVITQKDIEECMATVEDIAQVASILNTVPGTKFSLVLSEREAGRIKGSLRSEEYKGVDVSTIAHRLGGGGHKLASGFEVKGRVIETAEGWEIV